MLALAAAHPASPPGRSTCRSAHAGVLAGHRRAGSRRTPSLNAILGAHRGARLRRRRGSVRDHRGPVPGQLVHRDAGHEPGPDRGDAATSRRTSRSSALSAGLPRRSGAGTVLGIPVVVYYLVALALSIWYVLECTPLGRHLFATGANPEAARLSGVRTDRMVSARWSPRRSWPGSPGSSTAPRSARSPTPSARRCSSRPSPRCSSARPSSGPRPNVWGTILAVYTLAFGVKGLQLAFAAGAYWITPLFNGVALIVAVGLASRVPAVRRLRRRVPPAPAAVEPARPPSRPSRGDVMTRNPEGDTPAILTRPGRGRTAAGRVPAAPLPRRPRSPRPRTLRRAAQPPPRTSPLPHPPTAISIDQPLTQQTPGRQKGLLAGGQHPVDPADHRRVQGATAALRMELTVLSYDPADPQGPARPCSRRSPAAPTTSPCPGRRSRCWARRWTRRRPRTSR